MSDALAHPKNKHSHLGWMSGLDDLKDVDETMAGTNIMVASCRMVSPWRHHSRSMRFPHGTHTGSCDTQDLVGV